MAQPSHTILITGATSGFGEATAHRFAAEGWRVIITGRRKERLDALQRELHGLYGVAEVQAQPLRKGGQQGVAISVAHQVVDRGEVVDVEGQAARGRADLHRVAPA